MCKTMVMKMSLATMLLMLISMNGFSQNIGVKSNLLYWATTTPNIGLETSVGKKHTAQVFVGFNPWKQSGGDQPPPLACDAGIPLLVLPELQWLVPRCSCYGWTV